MPVLPVSVPAQVVSAPVLPLPAGLHLAPPLGSRPNPAPTWNQTDTALEAVFWTTFAVDWLQTLEVARHPYWCISTPCVEGVLPDGSLVVVPSRDYRFDRYSERNPLLGRHPNTRRVNAYFLATGLTYYLSLIHISEPTRPY